MKKYFLILGFILITISCKENIISPSNPKEIFPLNVGNNRIWKTTDYYSHGKEPFIYYDTLTVVKDTIINSINISIIKRINTLTNSNYFIWYYNDNEGFKQYMYNIGHYDSTLFYKYPGKVGDTFIDDGDTTTIEGINAICNINSVSYNCYKYIRYQYIMGYKFISYVAPGVGFVLEEFYYNNILSQKTELISYTVK